MRVGNIGLMENKEIGKMIAKRVAKERKIKGFTQKELGDRSDVKHSTLRRFEKTGKISFESLIKLIRGLGRLQSLEKFLDFDKEYKKLRYGQYQDIQRRGNLKRVQKKKEEK